jgi:hypothetical protein
MILFSLDLKGKRAFSLVQNALELFMLHIQLVKKFPVIKEVKFIKANHLTLSHIILLYFSHISLWPVLYFPFAFDVYTIYMLSILGY